MATDSSLRWNALNPSLLASTSLGHRSTSAHTFCSLCLAVDHTRTQCALTFLEPVQTAVSALPQRGPIQGAPRKPRNFPVCLAGTKGHVFMAANADTSMCAPTVRLSLIKHQTVHRLLLGPLQLTPAVLGQERLNFC